jgi:hypothetical protein
VPYLPYRIPRGKVCKGSTPADTQIRHWTKSSLTYLAARNYARAVSIPSGTGSNGAE